MPDIEERLIGDFLAIYPAVEEFLDTAYEWEDERVNDPEIAHEKLSHKDISVIVFLAESIRERISKLMSDPPDLPGYDEEDIDPAGYL
jgi:hypothetical protein